MTHPYPVPSSSELGSAERAAFADRLDRPAVVVASGPSAPFPAPEVLPDDAVVLRTGTFFLESQYHYGSRVDAYVWDGDRRTLDALAAELRAGRYTCERFVSAHQVLPTDGEHTVNSLSRLGMQPCDAYAPIFAHPRLARLLTDDASRPASELLAVAFAAAVGFTDIRLFGFDQIDEHSTARRIGTSIAAQVAARLSAAQADSSKPAARIDADLAFLRAVVAEFPAARITAGTPVPVFSSFIAPTAPEAEASSETQASSASGTGLPRRNLLKTHLTLGAGELHEVSPGNPEPWALIDGRRCAYVTLVSGNYHHGARALARSMAQVTDIPLIVMCAPGADRMALEASGLNCIDVPEIMAPRTEGAQARFAATYTKLNAFRLAFLDRAVYVDSDALMLNSADELFERAGFCAVPDAGIQLENDGFNSGVFAYDPSVELFDRMLAQVGRLPSADGGDQGFLNSFLGEDWSRLPLEYNTTKRIWRSHNPLFNAAEVKILHYVGVKPWTIDPGHADYGDVIDLWFDYLADFELRDLAREWSQHSSGRPAQDRPVARPVKKIKDAEQAYAAGRYAEAEQIAARILAWDPASIRSAKLLAELALRKRSYAQAARYAATAGLSFAKKRFKR